MFNYAKSAWADTFRSTLPFAFARSIAAMIVVSGCASASKQAKFVRHSGTGGANGLIPPYVWNSNADAVEEEVAESIREAPRRSRSAADDAVQIALLNNRRLQAVYEELGVSQAAIVDASLTTNPRFHGNA